MERLVICATLLAIVFLVAGDVCTFKRREGYTIDAVKNCVFQLPFRESVRTSVQATLSRWYPSYAFKDIIRDSLRSGSKYNISSRIEERLEKLKTDKFTYDYEFHVAVADIIGSAKDPHLAYRAPCYSMFIFFQPFRLGSQLWNGVQKLVVKPLLSSMSFVSDQYKKMFPDSNVPKWYGYHVKLINGRDAMTVMSQFADLYGWNSYDHQTRFNQVLKIDWYAYILGEDGIPEPIITYTLVDPTNGAEITVQFAFVSIALSDVNDVNHFKTICAYPDQVSTTPQSRQLNNHILSLLYQLTEYNSIPLGEIEKKLLFPWPMSPMMAQLVEKLSEATEQQLPKLRDQIQRILAVERSDERYQYWNIVHGNRILWKQHIIDSLKDKVERGTIRQSPSPKETIITNSEFSLYVWKSETIIFHLKTFLVSDYGDFIAKIVEKFNYIASKYKIKNMIIDLRGNGGGYVDLAFQLARWLVPRVPSVTYPIVDYPHNELNDQIFACDQYSLFYTVYDPTTGKLIPFGNNTWYKQGIRRERGGVSGTYSTPVHMQTPSVIPSFPGNNPFYSFGMSNLTLLSDGDCGSACGMFLSLLQQLREAKVVSLGGIVGMGSMGVASFYGATVQQFTSIVSSLSFMKLFGDCQFTQFDPLPMRAIYTTSQLEMYPWVPKIAAFEKWKTDTSLPLALVFTAADFHLNQWVIDETDNEDQLYAEAVETFNYCAPQEFLTSNCQTTGTRFGVYGYPCSNTTGRVFNTTSCTLYTCEEKYHVNDDGSMCVENRGPDLTEPYTITRAIRDMIVRSLLIAIIVLLTICVCCCVSILLIVIVMYCLCYRKRATITDESGLYEGMIEKRGLNESQSV